MKTREYNTDINNNQKHATRIRVILSIFISLGMLMSGVHWLICLAISINMVVSIAHSVGVARQNNINRALADCINVLAHDTGTDVSITQVEKKTN